MKSALQIPSTFFAADLDVCDLISHNQEPAMAVGFYKDGGPTNFFTHKLI